MKKFVWSWMLRGSWLRDRMMMENIERIHCSRCLRSTKHIVIKQYKQNHEEIVGEDESCPLIVDWTVKYTVLECCGCENVIMRRIEYYPDGGVDDIQYYPPLISRQMPKWHLRLPKVFQDLLREIYTALHADSRMLVLMGARTIIDLFMNDKIGDTGGFSQKLQGLVSQGYLSINNQKILNAALEAGNATIHRAYKPEKEHVNAVIDIVENLIQSYVLEEDANQLKNVTPQRNKKKPQ